MTVQNLLQDLAGRGIILAVNRNQLDIDAPDDFPLRTVKGGGIRGVCPT